MKLLLISLVVALSDGVMSQNIKVEEITNEAQRCELGEGPHWDVERQSLYFVDITGSGSPAIFRYNFKNKEIYRATIKNSSDPIGFITPVDGTADEFVVGLGRELTVIRWDGRSARADVLKVLSAVDFGFEANRINDGKADPSKRIFFGTMGDPSTNLKENPTGSLYRFDGEGSLKLRESIGIGNGLAWNENLGKFYYIDSVARDVKVFDYDSSSGNITNEEILVDFNETHPDEEFVPDGMTIDENGTLYVATWQGSKIFIINPTSKTIENEINIPTSKVTSAAFGGPNLDVLFVTTASKDGPKEGAAGGLFKVTGLGVKGLPMSNFKLY